MINYLKKTVWWDTPVYGHEDCIFTHCLVCFQQKRPAGPCDDTGPYPKKQRIAHGSKKSSRPNSPSVHTLAPSPVVPEISKGKLVDYSELTIN